MKEKLKQNAKREEKKHTQTYKIQEQTVYLRSLNSRSPLHRSAGEEWKKKRENTKTLKERISIHEHKT